MQTFQIQNSDGRAAVLKVVPAPSEPPADYDDCPIWEIIVDSMKHMEPEITATLLHDGASQHDHYIYGWPKREE